MIINSTLFVIFGFLFSNYLAIGLNMNKSHMKIKSSNKAFSSSELEKTDTTERNEQKPKNFNKINCNLLKEKFEDKDLKTNLLSSCDCKRKDIKTFKVNVSKIYCDLVTKEDRNDCDKIINTADGSTCNDYFIDLVILFYDICN